MSIISKKLKDVFNKNKGINYDEVDLLKSSISHLKNELDKFKNSPLLVCEYKGKYGNKAMIRVPNGAQFMVNFSDGLNLKPGDSILVEQRSLTIIEKLEKVRGFDVESHIIVQKPDLKWEDLGGLNMQIDELKEVIELPLKRPDLFKEIGIIPPKGVLLYGPPGTGKTLLAKAVATSTNSTFINVVAPELVQKFIGEGAKMVKEIFKLAKEKAPSIIFIDEIDSISGERVNLGVSGEREVQRTFMQLLSEIDGFNNLENVKIIAATNRLDIIDPALLRPGRFDRLIEIDLPDSFGREQIFKIHTRDMKLEGVDFKQLVEKTNNFSGAEIKSICTEAGYFAIRNKRNRVKHIDFLKSLEKLNFVEDEPVGMFG